MLANNKENPLYEHFDRLLDIAKRYDITLSLGDGLRPGSVFDATDELQISELVKLGELCEIALENDVQVMVEGPGHVPLNQVEENIRLQKILCKGAPFYVLGPLVTDSAAGYDHIACAIGGAIAAHAGADFLCYVTPAEHLGLPNADDVREGVIACKIAGHAADLARKRPKAIARDHEMAVARQTLDWETQIRLCPNPEKARRYRSASESQNLTTCTMCGNLCAVKLINELNQKS
jgi:phosphomethylpyrimidine synthase